MSDKFTEQIKTVAESMYQGIVQKDMQNNMDWILEKVEKHTPEKLSTLSRFEIYINSKSTTQNQSMFEYLYQNGFIKNALEKQGKDKIQFIFLKYSFIKHQLGSFIRETSGFSCSQDKLSFILNAYVSELAGIQSDWDNTKYWVPSAGSKEQWFELVESIRDLFYAIDYGERRLQAMKAIATEFSKIE